MRKNRNINRLWLMMLYACIHVHSYAQSKDYEYLKYYQPNHYSVEHTVNMDPFQLEVVKKALRDRPIKGQEELRIKVIDAIGGENIEGVVHGRGSITSKVLIKGWIFSPVDEITFPQGDGSRLSPVSGKTIMLLDIQKNSVLVRVCSEEDSEATEFSISLDSFYQ